MKLLSVGIQNKQDYIHCCEVSNILIDSGAICSVQVCLYPPYADKCIDAAKYYYENSKCLHISPKSLQESIVESKTMVYDKEFLDTVMKYDGQPNIGKKKKQMKIYIKKICINSIEPFGKK